MNPEHSAPTPSSSEIPAEQSKLTQELKQIIQDAAPEVASPQEAAPEDAAPEDASTQVINPEEAVPEAATPEEREEILRLVNNSALSSSTTEEIFSDDQITEISQDPEKFEQALTQLIADKPNEAMACLPYILKHYSPDEARGLIVSLAEKNPAWLYKFMDQEVIELIGEDAVAQIAKRALEGDSLPSTDTLAWCVTKGYFTKAQLAAIVLNDIETVRNNPEEQHDTSTAAYQLLRSANFLLQMQFYTDEEKAEIHDKVLALFQNSGDGYFDNLELIPMFTQEDKNTLFQDRFAADPVAAVGRHFSMVETYIEPEVAREAILLYAADASSELPSKFQDILGSSLLTPEDKRTVVIEMQKNNPAAIFSVLSQIDGTSGEEIFSHDEISTMMRNYLQSVSLAESFSHIDEFAKFIDTAELKAILVAKFAEHPTLDLFTFTSSDTLNQLFTAEEQLSMLDQSIEQQLAAFGEGGYALYQINFNSIQQIFGDEVLKDVADRILAVSPEALIRIFGSVGHLYDNQEITDIARVLSTTQSGQEALFAMATGPEAKWSDIVDKEVVRELIINADPKFYKDIAQLENLDRYFSLDEISSLASKILAANPITAVRHPEFFTQHVPGFDANSVLEQALENPAQMAVLGKYLAETIKIAQNGSASARDRALTDADEMYVLIERLSRAGRLEGFKELHAKFELKAKTERSLIETYSIISTLGSSEDLAALESIDTIEAVEHIATQALAHSLGIESDITPDRSQRLLEQLGSTVPLGLYVAQYRSSPQHLALLKPMVEAILDGNYEYWKFGSGPESLLAMKSSGLIPANTTEEQYAIWQKESESESREAFTVEAGTAIDTIRTIFTTEAAQFPESSLISPSEKTAALEAIVKEMPGFGQKIAEIHQKLKILREQPDAERDKEQITELENEVSALSQEMKNLQIQQDIIQLTHLTEEEVRSGFIQLGDDQKRRPIESVVARLRKNLKGDALVVLKRVEAALGSFKEQTRKDQTLRVIDTASPKITIEIGDVPMASCQNFRNGIINEALLGYTDPNTKVLFLTDEDGTPIARSIFRLLSDEAGNPALHVETIYTRLATDGVTRAVYQHAAQKAKAMGIPLFVSSASQNAEGVVVDTRDIEGITRIPSAAVLSSAQSRAPSVYVDSAGGEVHGPYSMTNVATLS